MNITEKLTAFAMLGAGWVLWLLVVLSVVGLAIVLERGYYLIASRDDIGRLKVDFLSLLRKNDIPGLKKRLALSKSVEARVLAGGLEVLNGGPDAVEDRMAGEAQLARLAMERNLAFLGTVGNNAPFVGLLGTVIGVMRAFAALDQSGGQVSEGLMAEIGEALVATAIGLLVAIPAVAFFNLFYRTIKLRIGRADALGRDLLAYLKERENSGGGHEARAEAAE